MSARSRSRRIGSAIRESMREGWMENRWRVFFALILVPALIPITLLVYFLPVPPSLSAVVEWVGAGVAAAVALFVAGLMDGDAGPLGRYVWALVRGWRR